MPILAEFKTGDKVKISGIEPSRNPDFPFDLFKGQNGTVTKVDSHDLVVWVRIDGYKPLAFEPWELEKLQP